MVDIPFASLGSFYHFCAVSLVCFPPLSHHLHLCRKPASPAGCRARFARSAWECTGPQGQPFTRDWRKHGVNIASPFLQLGHLSPAYWARATLCTTLFAFNTFAAGEPYIWLTFEQRWHNNTKHSLHLLSTSCIRFSMNYLNFQSNPLR